MGVISVYSNHKHSQFYNMSAPAVASPTKKVAKKPKEPAVHPTYAVMIAESIKTLKDRTGSSRQAILKYICANYKVDAAKATVHVRTALKKGVAAGTLKMGGAPGKKGAGCFKLGDNAKEEKPKAKKPKSPKKSAAKKPAAKKSADDKSATKKPATAKKPANEKSKAKKTAAKKPAASKKSPKKPAAKKSPTKKPAAKKSPVKKPAAKK